jgi:succinate dehydrogenase/fumarate reductase-like Fe-S protein
MLINGVNRLACKVLVKDLGERITIEPIRGLPVLKDLIVDMEPFFDSYKAVLPFFINDDPPPPGERCRAPRTARSSTRPPSASCAPPAPPAARSSGPTAATSAPPRS